MKAPVITSLRNTGHALIATIEGQEVALTTFRETLWRQSKVYLPPPFTERCEPQLIQTAACVRLTDPSASLRREFPQ